jgi:predicted RNA binding protein YcfA (HicA-like mRNA interferase family)
MSPLSLPVCSGDDAIRAFIKAGWHRDRQKGSHVTLKKPGSTKVLTVPRHPQLSKGVLRKLIRDSDLTIDEFGRNL